MKGKLEKSSLPEDFSELEAILSEIIALRELSRNCSTHEKRKQTHQTHSNSLKIQQRSNFKAVLFMAERGLRFLPWDDKEDRPAYKWKGENQKNFSNDHDKLIKWQGLGYKRYLYLPGLSGYIGFDIDRGHADGKDGLAGVYEIMLNLAGKRPERLPYYLRDLPNNFPCNVETPFGGLHLLFKYCGPCKMANIIHGDNKLEVMYLNHTLSLGEKQKGTYVLYGDPLDAPELPPFLIELINPQSKLTLQVSKYQKRGKPSLDQILTKVLVTSNGNNDTQMKFAWRTAYFGHPLDEVLAFVMSHPDAFGNGSDTEIVIKHSWHSNTARVTI
jgi:hypothetical protein